MRFNWPLQLSFKRDGYFPKNSRILNLRYPNRACYGSQRGISGFRGTSWEFGRSKRGWGSFVPHADTEHRKRGNRSNVKGIRVYRRQNAVGPLQRRLIRSVLNRGCNPYPVAMTILKSLKEAMVASTGFEPVCDRMVLGAYKWSVFSDRNE